MQSVIQDVRYALRIARQNPWSTAAALIALTIGIGATAAMFTIVNGVVVRPLPVRDASRLVRLFQTAGGARIPVGMEDYLDWKRDLKSFDGMALFRAREANLTGDGNPERVDVFECESSLLPLLGLTPIRGRNFTPEENQPDNGQTALLSWHFWQRRFGGAPVLGRKILLNDRPYTIIGIIPDALDVLGKNDVSIPLSFDFNDIINTRGFRFYRVMARLRPGVSLKTALGEAASLSHALAQRYPKENRNIGVTGMYLHDWMDREIRPALLVLFAAVFAVLLIACGNVANLLLVRASARRREMSVRVAIGANRWRLVRQLLTECFLLSFTGAILGLGVAAVGVHFIISAEASHLPRPSEVVLDWRVAAFVIAVAVASSLIFGLAPAFSISRARANDALKELSGRVTESRGQQHTKRVFIAITTAIATLLLIESALLMKTFARISGINPGFDPHHVITMRVALPEVRYDAGKHPGVVGNFVEQARYRIQTIPGVQDAAFTSDLPLLGASVMGSVLVKGTVPPKNWFDPPLVHFTRVSPNYFKTMRIPIVEGRDFNDHDDNNSQKVAIVNQAFARRFLRGRDPVGSVVRPYAPIVLWFPVVGVVGNYRQDGMDEASSPEMFTCVIQEEGTQLAIVARTAGDPLSFVKPIQRIIHDADPLLPVYQPLSMDQIVERELGWRSFHTSVLTALAAIAILLAAIGIYAVAAYSVVIRTPEIGVRMALGAQKSDITKMILRNGVAPAIYGTLAGAVCAVALRRVLAGFLYGVTATDLPTYAGVIAFLLLVSVAATVIPALRAASIEPSRALRHQ